MTTHDMDGLVGEHERDVPYEVASGIAARPLAGVRAKAADGSGRGARVLEPELVVQRQPNGRFLINGRFEVEITLHQYRPRRGLPLWVASALLETPHGPMQWSASATEHEVARRLARGRAVAGFDLGQELGRLFGINQGSSNRSSRRGSTRGRRGRSNRATRRGAQNLAFQRVIRDVRRTLDSPGGRAVTSVLSAIPYVGQVVQGVRAATTLVDNVARGNTRSRRNLQRLHRASRRGDANARRAVGVVEHVLRMQRRIAVQRVRAPGRRTARSPEEERAWREADRRWNEYRAARAAEGLRTPEPLITPPPRPA